MSELEIIQHWQMEGLSIFFDTVDYRTSHVHPEWELIWILDQPLSVTCEKQELRVEPGSLVLFNPNAPHEFRKIEQSSTFLCLQLSPAVLPSLPMIRVDELLPQRYLTDDQMSELKWDITALVSAYLRMEGTDPLYCMGLCYLILHKLLQNAPSHQLTAAEAADIGKRNARLERLIRFVEENYMHKLKLADFARQEGCSLSYLSKFIKNTMNQTFQEYVTSVRFHCACQLIAEGEKKLLEVCVESGFSDYRYFSREFHRQYGMSPEAYRRSEKKLPVSAPTLHRSIHSSERFYSKEDSIMLLKKYCQ